jgi:hypothetical protein
VTGWTAEKSFAAKLLRFKELVMPIQALDTVCAWITDLFVGELLQPLPSVLTDSCVSGDRLVAFYRRGSTDYVLRHRFHC